MDQSAYNYNVSANVHDSITCLYNANCVTGAGNPYWLNDICYAWVISVDDYCCNNDWDNICQLTYNHCQEGLESPLPQRVIKTERNLIMITDVLGRISKENDKKLLFYIYDNGDVIKKIKQ